jgi:hypothetical protein
MEIARGHDGFLRGSGFGVRDLLAVSKVVQSWLLAGLATSTIQKGFQVSSKLLTRSLSADGGSAIAASNKRNDWTAIVNLR